MKNFDSKAIMLQGTVLMKWTSFVGKLEMQSMSWRNTKSSLIAWKKLRHKEIKEQLVSQKISPKSSKTNKIWGQWMQINWTWKNVKGNLMTLKYTSNYTNQSQKHFWLLLYMRFIGYKGKCYQNEKKIVSNLNNYRTPHF